MDDGSIHGRKTTTDCCDERHTHDRIDAENVQSQLEREQSDSWHKLSDGTEDPQVFVRALDGGSQLEERDAMREMRLSEVHPEEGSTVSAPKTAPSVIPVETKSDTAICLACRKAGVRWVLQVSLAKVPLCGPCVHGLYSSISSQAVELMKVVT